MSTRDNGNYFHFVTFLAINSKNNKGFIRIFLHLQTHWAVSCKPWTLAELLWLLQNTEGQIEDRQTHNCQILMSVRLWANTLVIWVFTHNTTQCQHLVSRLCTELTGLTSYTVRIGQHMWAQAFWKIPQQRAIFPCPFGFCA